MIKNWFKRKNEVVFSCDIQYGNAFNYFKPNHSGTFMPEWFKNLPSTYEIQNKLGLRYDHPTVRTCHGIKKTLTNGIILPLWTDIIIEVFPDKTWRSQSSDELTSMKEHQIVQHTGLFEKCCILKLWSPWIVQSEKTTSLFLTQPLYHQGDINDFFVLPGFLSFNKQPSPTNIFIGIPYKNEPQRIKIKSGFPIVQFINTTREVIDIKTKLVSKDEFYSQVASSSFTKSFEKQLKIAERNE